MKIRIVAAVVALMAIACERERRSPTGLRAQLRDSVGIRIVENARPAEGSRLDWRIGPEPAISIGELEGEEARMLFGVTDATKLSDGRIVVVNGGSGELRVFSAAGTHWASWGGRGEGPGEFDNLNQVERLPGDSVVAWEFLGASLTLFDGDGNFVRTSRVERRAADLPTHEFHPLSAMGDGSVLASLHPSFVDTVTVEVWDTDGGLRSSLGTHVAREPHTVVGRTSYERIFGWTLAREPWGELIVISRTGRYEIKAFAQDGTLARIVRRDHVPRPPAEAHIEAHIESQVSRVPAEMVEYRARKRRELQAVPVAEHLPAFASVMSDALDHLWVEEFEPPGEKVPGTLWTVFDPEGRVLGFVETPEGLEIYEIGADYILGRVEGELEVESVQVWPLER